MEATVTNARWWTVMLPGLLLAGCERADEPKGEDSASDTGVIDTIDSNDPCADLELPAVSLAAVDQGDPAEIASVAALIASVPDGCTAALELAEAGAYAVGRDLEVPAQVTLAFTEGAWLDVALTGTLTVDGGLDAGRWQIFGGEGALGGAPQIEAAYPEWFGAVPDDDMDDHQALQRAAEFFASVSLQVGIYDLAGTVTLSDGARLAGPEGDAPTASLRSVLVYPDTGGFHPTRMLEATGAADLEIRDLVLDGNRHAHTVEPWHYPETDNLVRFDAVTGLLVERVHITGWEANWGIEDQSYAHATAVIRSSDVSFIDVDFTDSRTEGLLFEDSDQVTITGLSTRNTDVWSPLNAFYVRGFSLTGSTIIEDEGIEWTGSTVNLSVSDATVRDNVFTGGWGIDFGDEAGTTPWGPAGILVEDNSIETVGAGIYFSPYADGDLVTDVVVRGNDLTLHRGASSVDTDVMIRVDAAADVLIEDNTLTVPDGGEALVQGIAFRGSTDGVLVQDNLLSGVDSGISHSGDTAQGGSLSILRNTIQCASEIRMDSWNGGSTGVWIFRYQAAEFDTITVQDNTIDGVGGWVSLIDYATLYSDPAPFADALVVSGNSFAPEGGSERNIASEAASVVTISGNTPEWVNE